MRKIKATVSDFIHELQARKGVNFLGIVAHTSSRFNLNGELNGVPVINRHCKKIRHVWTLGVMVGANLQRQVDKIRKAKGLEPRQLGPNTAGMEHVPGVPLVRSKKDHLCLAILADAVVQRSQYHNVETGEKIDRTYLKPFRSPYTFEALYFTIGLENIKEAKINGKRLIIDSSTYADAEAAFLASLPAATA